MLTAAVLALSFAFAGFIGGWATCNRLKDRRAERAEAKLMAYALAARIDPAHHKSSHCSCHASSKA